MFTKGENKRNTGRGKEKPHEIKKSILWPLYIVSKDLNPNVILIEIGGHENNIDEVNNTFDLVADAIKEYLNEEG